MKRFFAANLVSLLIVILTSCEVFKTTPKSSPNYRARGSQSTAPRSAPKENRTSSQNTLVGRMSERKKQAQVSSDKRRTSTSAHRSARSSSTANTRSTLPPTRSATPAAKATAPKKELASRPTGSYDKTVPEVVQIARTYTGTPYRSGGNDKQGIDCSGLICQVYTEMGIKVPRISWQQSEFGREIEQIKDLRSGDWIFFVPEGGKEGYVSHSGIVTEVRGANDILFIHASSSRGVVEDNLFSNYFRNRFVKAIRPF